MIFDTHAHYDDRAFDADREQILREAHAAGIGRILDPGCDAKSSRAAVALAERFDFVYAAVGIHPEELESCDEEALLEIRTLAEHPKCLAIGEIGLDYYWDDSHKQEQKQLFRWQIELALELNKPVIVHDREAHADTLALLKRHRPKGVLHCYSGSVETMREAVDLGLFIGLGGAVTFKNAKKPLAVAAAVPADRLLLETDCPYMAPVPFRGKRNDSSLIFYVAQTIAEVRGMETQALIDQCRENANRLFGVD